MSELVPGSEGSGEVTSEAQTSSELVPSGGGEVTTEAQTSASEASSAAPAVAPKPGKLASEKVIINAPMSFAGAAQRAFRLRGDTTGLARVAATIGVILLTLVWWVAVVGWYVIFGILLVPYRFLRRGARKRKAEALRHRELLSALDKKDK